MTQINADIATEFWHRVLDNAALDIDLQLVAEVAGDAGLPPPDNDEGWEQLTTRIRSVGGWLQRELETYA